MIAINFEVIEEQEIKTPNKDKNTKSQDIHRRYITIKRIQTKIMRQCPKERNIRGTPCY